VQQWLFLSLEKREREGWRVGVRCAVKIRRGLSERCVAELE
jgi:hypothetical protein